MASRGNRSSGFLTRYDRNWAVQPKESVRALNFQIYDEEGLFYLCSENKDTDQLDGYCAADLRQCFCRCKKADFLMTRLKLSHMYMSDLYSHTTLSAFPGYIYKSLSLVSVFAAIYDSICYT